MAINRRQRLENLRALMRGSAIYDDRPWPRTGLKGRSVGPPPEGPEGRLVVVAAGACLACFGIPLLFLAGPWSVLSSFGTLLSSLGALL